MPLIRSARESAIEAHGEQRYGDHPYVWHLDAVAAIAEPYGKTAQVIAYLHDTVEDTSVTLDEVRQRFGDMVAACVELLTDEPGATRKIRKAKTYARQDRRSVGQRARLCGRWERQSSRPLRQRTFTVRGIGVSSGALRRLVGRAGSLSHLVPAER